MTRAYVITLSDNKSSFEQADILIDSSAHYHNRFVIEKNKATTSDEVVAEFLSENIKWNYPWSKQHLDIQTGLIKTAYETADPKKRMACFMSHYKLWKKCAETQEDLLIFEHDAKFIRPFDVEEVKNTKFSVISLNDPRGATRRSGVYHELLMGKGVTEVPWIDDQNVPQGLPGNSAYYLKPEGASRLLKLVSDFGAWPNDAIMCKQLMMGKLGCLSKYATVVQRTQPSTTTT